MAGAGNGGPRGNGRGDDGGKGPRRFTISLSLPGMVVAVTVLLFGLAWTFVLGVLVGRGYSPESAVPEIAALMPGAANSSKGEVQVLKPEDLQYLDDLTKKPAPPPASLTAKAPAKPKPPEKPADKTADKPANATAPAQAQAQAPAPATAPAPAQAKALDQTPLDAETGGQVYRYLYQVAAFPDPASAQDFRTRLAGIGLASSLEKTVDPKGRTWHRVLVHFTGAPEDTRGLKDKLAELGISRVILRDKKPN